MQRLKTIGKFLAELGLFYLRVLSVALVCWVLANAGAAMLFPATLVDDTMSRSIYFEEREATAWTGWAPISATVEMYPATSPSLIGALPNPSSTTVLIRATAQRKISGGSPDFVPPIALVRVNVPESVRTGQSGGEEVFETSMDDMVSQFSAGADYQVVYSADEPRRLPNAGTSRFDVEPTIVLVTGAGSPFYLAEYSITFEVPNTMIKREGIWSGISKLVWAPRLAEFTDGMGSIVETFEVRACSCGLRVASPNPTGAYTASTEWSDAKFDSQESYEYSTDTFMDDLNEWCDRLFVPAVLGLLISVLFKQRSRRVGASGSLAAVGDKKQIRKPRHRKSIDVD